MTAGVFGSRQRRKGKQLGYISGDHRRLFKRKGLRSPADITRSQWLGEKRRRNIARTLEFFRINNLPIPVGMRTQA